MSATDLRTLTKARADHFTAAVTRLVDKGLVTPIDREGVYHFDKRDSHVIVAHISPEFAAALVDRWTYLEEAIRQAPRPHMVTFVDAAHLLNRKPNDSLWNSIGAVVSHARSYGLVDQTEGAFYDNNNFKLSLPLLSLLASNRAFRTKPVPTEVGKYLQRHTSTISLGYKTRQVTES